LIAAWILFLETTTLIIMNDKYKVGDEVQISGEKYEISHVTRDLFGTVTLRVRMNDGPHVYFAFACVEFIEEHFPKEPRRISELF